MECAADKSKNEYDIVICGAGIAGLTLARQITKEIPEASLLLIEGTGDKSRTGAIQVGESTIEISANYLAHVVDLSEYLEASHYRKWGFRFFFGHGDTPIQERPELGSSHASPLPSYQLDRAMLERDIKKFNKALGIHMLEEMKVEDIVLANENGWHEIRVLHPATNQRSTIKCSWIVDAMGRRRFLQRKLGIAMPHNPLYSASWFRLKGRIDISDLVSTGEREWHGRVQGDNRYYSTNHLMDNGRWVWLIPLASGHTSIGIVANEAFFPFSHYNTFELALRWLEQQEPALWRHIHTMRPVDFQCLRHYSYSARQVFSLQRWACTGDAAVFSDPFLSPGIDQAAFANTLITEMIKRERVHRLSSEMVEHFNQTFLAFHNGTAWVTQPAYAFYGKDVVIGTKLAWDILRGFSVNASARFNHIYLDEQKTKALQPVLSRLFLLALRMEKIFKDWAAATSGRYSYQFVDYFALPGMLDLYHRNLRAGKSLEELVDDHQNMLTYFEELAQVIFLMALADVHPDTLAHLPSPLWLNAWGIGLDPGRWKADKLFAPASQPRTLRKVSEFAVMFGMGNLLSYIE